MGRRDQRLQNVLGLLRHQIDSSFGPGDRLPSKRELAAMYGVGTATIERAMKLLTAEGQVTVMPGVGVRKTLADSNSKKPSRRSDRLTVGVITRRHAEELATNEMYTALQDEARKRGIDVVAIPNPHQYRTSAERSRIELSRVPWNSFDVGLLVETEHTIKFQDPQLLKHKVLAVDHDATGFGIDSVAFDDAEAGAIAARHLLELGHTRFALTDEYCDPGYASDPATMARKHGFEKAVGAAGGMLPPCWRIPVPKTSPADVHLRLIKETVKAWTAAPVRQRPTALFAVSLQPFGAGQLLPELARSGIRVPRDLSIVTVTWNRKFWGGSEPVIDGIRFASVDMNLSALVCRVFDAASELASEKRTPANLPRRPKCYLAPTIFVPGPSSAAPPA